MDEATDTVYVALKANGDYAGTVAVIDGATCNGTDTTGCGQLSPTVPAGFGVNDVAVDAATGTVYVTNNEDATVSLIDGAICNGRVSFGCDLVPPKLAAGIFPTRSSSTRRSGRVTSCPTWGASRWCRSSLGRSVWGDCHRPPSSTSSTASRTNRLE